MRKVLIILSYLVFCLAYTRPVLAYSSGIASGSMDGIVDMQNTLCRVYISLGIYGYNCPDAAKTATAASKGDRRQFVIEQVQFPFMHWLTALILRVFKAVNG